MSDAGHNLKLAAANLMATAIELARLGDKIRALEEERDAAYRRIDDLANECQPHLIEIASLKEQLERANHALSLTGRTQSAARA